MKIEINKYKDICRVIFYFFGPYKVQVAFVYCSMFVASLFETLNLAVLYPLMNYGLKQETQGIILQQFYTVINLFGNENLFLSTCVLMIIITVLAVFFRYLNSLLQYRLLAKIDTAIQNKVLDKYLKADYIFFMKNQQGRLVHAATIAPGSVGNMILYTARTINDVTTCILMVLFLVILSWQATIIIAVIGFLYFLFVRRVMVKIIYDCGLRAVEANREKNVVLNELINGIKTIKVFLSHKSWEEKYHDAVKRSVQNVFKMLMGRIFPESFIKAVLYLCVAVIGIVISIKTGGSIISLIPLYGTLTLVGTRLSPLVNAIGSDFMILAESLPNTKIVYDLFNENTQNIINGTKTFMGFKRDIVFKDIWFKYEGMDKYMFKGVELSIEKNKVTAIAGFSGSGKTTLINLLLRLYVVEKGQILIDGTDVSEYTLDSCLAKIGYVSQETFLYNDTIKENIRFGMTNCSDEMIVEATKQANAHDFIMSMPNGYETVVGDSGMKLSGGQRQRIAIARAALRNPEIMILDEATSALDNISENKVQEAIYNVSQHTTVIIVAHRLSTIQNADKILLLHNGRIVEEGLHDELLARNGKYFELYERQLTAIDANGKEPACERG